MAREAGAADDEPGRIRALPSPRRRSPKRGEVRYGYLAAGRKAGPLHAVKERVWGETRAWESPSPGRKAVESSPPTLDG